MILLLKNGTGFTGRKVKGTIHWVPVHHCKKVTARLYENLVDEEKVFIMKMDL